MKTQWLALGDSYTFGEGVVAADRWTSQLARALRERGIDVADPRIVATTGWTTEELAAGIAMAEALGAHDFVTLCIGVNDQYRGRGVAEYRAQLTSLLDTATTLAGGRADRLLMLSIPDWGVTRFARNEGRDPAAIGREIDAFNDAARAMCDERGVAYVDITPVSRVDGDVEAMLVDDGLHPSGAMYARWVDVVLPLAQRVLANA